MSDTYSHSVLASPAALLPIDARLTEIDPPGGDGAQAGALAYAYHFLGMSEVYNNNYTGPDAALCYSAVWGCVRAITQGLAPLSWHTYERSADGRLRIPVEDPTAWIIDLQANPEMSALAWREVMLKDALTSPGGFSEIERTAAGRPNWLWPLAQGRVCPDRLESGELIYEVENGSGQKNTILTPMQVFHVKGITYDGVVGYDLIELMRRAIKLGLQEEQFGSQVFGKGPLPGGIVSVPGNMTREQRTEFRKGFEQAYTGQANAGRIIVLSNGVTFSAASLPNDSAQFLESRRYQVSEICRFYGVPPHKLADLERATFSNIEEQEIAFVRDCLLPWARRLETEADIKLFGPVQRGRRFTKLNLDALMRGNSATQTQTVTSKVSAGLMTINEGRTYFDLNPIDGGDTALIQGAMVRLEDVIDPPEPAPVPPSPPPPNPNEQESGKPAPQAPPPGAKPGNRAAAVRVFGVLLTDFYARMLRIEADRAKRALSRGQGQLAAHIAEFYPAHEEFVAGLLCPFFEGLALALGGSPQKAPALAVLLACGHVTASKENLRSAPEGALTFWAGDRARMQADLVVTRLVAEFDESQVERDESGRFGSGGGGGGESKESGDRSQESDSKESGDKQAEHDKEDEQVQEERDDEDSTIDEARSEEDGKRDDARLVEDGATQEARDAEDEAVQAERDKEDGVRDDARTEEDDAESDARGKEDDARTDLLNAEHDVRETEDARRADEDTDIQASREKEDGERQDAREKEGDAITERHEKGEITDQQRLDEHAANAERYQDEDDAIEVDREQADGERELERGKEDDRRDKWDEKHEKEGEKLQDKRDKEDEKTESKREKEDEKVSAKREKEDEKREEVRDRADEKRDGAREKADARVEAAREKEDAAREKEREKQDKERQKSRK